MQVWALASGSSGNCYLLESEGTRLLVECGRPLKDVLGYLDRTGVRPESLDGIVLTHAHGDHSKSAQELSDRYQVPLYASRGTLGAPNLRYARFANPIQAEQPFTIGEIEVRPFAVPHDCYEPLGFRFESNSARVIISTDLGFVPDTVQAQLVDVDLAVLEANYEPQLLEAGRYPAFLKRRVAGALGHLSNQEAAHALAACGDHAPKAVWLAHISENNNTQEQALLAVKAALSRRGLKHVPVGAARHRRPSLHWNSAVALVEQLSLF